MADTGSRPYTSAVIQRLFLEYLWHAIDRFDKNATPGMTSRKKLQRLSFDLLALLDGSNTAFPEFIVAPNPHTDDREYLIQKGTNYFPENDPKAVITDIAGTLHDEFFPIGKQLGLAI